MIAPSCKLTMIGREVDTSPQALGELRDSRDACDDVAELHRRMGDDGYLFLRGYLDRDRVMAARHEVCRRLADRGALDDQYPIIEAIARPGLDGLDHDARLLDDNEPMMELLYSGRMMSFYESFLAGRVAHFDYTWFRVRPPGGQGTPPHCDVVYMGRGTQNLFSSWTPIGDVSLEDGALAIIERSHRVQRLRDRYCKRDVDAVCTNRLDRTGQPKKQSASIGSISNNPVRMRAALGLPFVTTKFKAGDLLVFTVHTLHCSFDNLGKRIRMSTDSRYQLASEPLDERWISIDGQPPIAHGDKARRELIC